MSESIRKKCNIVYFSISNVSPEGILNLLVENEKGEVGYFSYAMADIVDKIALTNDNECSIEYEYKKNLLTEFVDVVSIKIPRNIMKNQNVVTW